MSLIEITESLIVNASCSFSVFIMDEFDRESTMSIGSSEDNKSQDSSVIAAAASSSNADAEENYYSVEMVRYEFRFKL